MEKFKHRPTVCQRAFSEATPTSPFVLDLSGYGFSGKQACSDLIREFDGYQVEDAAFEFNLLRVPGGLLDLEAAVTDGWSFIRSDGAVRRFQRVVSRIATPNRLSRPKSWFQAIGWSWDDHYYGQFSELSRRFVDQIVEGSWKMEWPFAWVDEGAVEIFLRKLAVRLGIRKAAEFSLHLVRPECFHAAAADFLMELLRVRMEAQTRVIVLHNAFEPYHPERCFRFFPVAKSIVVSRDPRDVFAEHAQTWYEPMRIPCTEFIPRFRAYQELSGGDGMAPGVLRIRFEELTLRYDETVERILSHLGEPASVHVRKLSNFNPEVSRRNVGVWREQLRPADARRIEAELGDYCWELW